MKNHMKKRLQLKFSLSFLVLGVLAFLLISSLSAVMVSRSIMKAKAENLYAQANDIAEQCETSYAQVSQSIESRRNEWRFKASALNATIWVINTQGKVLFDSGYQHLESVIEGLDVTSYGGQDGLPNYAGIGNFYGNVAENTLSVVAPIHLGYTNRGYVVIHYNMSNLSNANYEILNIMYYTGAIVFALAAFLLLVFRFIVSRPLKEIIHAADEYADGNLSYRCKVKTKDELGYLSATLNYMTDDLAHSEEYQRQFISNMSHDFRSPLTTIRGYLVAIQDGTIPPELYDKYLGIVIRETERLTKLTEGLLTLNQLNKGDNSLNLNMSEFDINQVIKDVCTTYESRCREKRITFKLTFSDKEKLVRGDFTRIQQVVYNLIDNAMKFSNMDSSIDIVTREKNGKVFVSVKDHGCGIPKEHQKKIFDRFYKADNSRGKDRQGTGLGLAIVKEIITAHKQTIDVVSTVDVGTEFTFTLQKAKASGVLDSKTGNS